MSKHPKEKAAEIIILIEVFLHAFWPVGANYGAKLIPQIQFLAFITLLSSVFFLFTTLYRKEFRHLKSAYNLKWLSLYTICLSILPYGIITYATRYTSAINTTIFTQIEAVYAAILGYFFFKEKLTKKRIIAIFFILLANVILVYNGTFQIHSADIALLTAPIIFVFGNAIAKKLQAEGIGWSIILFYRNFVGGIVLLTIAHFVEGLSLPPQDLWPFLLIFSILVFGLAKILWQIALHNMDVSKVTALGMTYPVISIAIAYLWLGEIPSIYQSIGILFTLLGIYFLVQTKSVQWEDI